MSLFKKKPLILYAPVEGTAVRLNEVADEVFSQGFLGNGMAIRPTGGTIVAPCDGKVDMVAETCHAINLVSADGAEVLIHVGIDTVKLAGQGFAVSVEAGQTVKTGDILLTFDADVIRNAGLDTDVILTVCNTDEYKSVEQLPAAGASVHAGDKALSCQK